MADALYLYNVMLLRGETSPAGSPAWSPGAVLLRDGIIAGVDPPLYELPADCRKLDGVGGLLAPGFIDLQLNGAFGDDFTADPATIWRVAAGLPRYGVTGFLPTIITSPLATIAAAQETLVAGPPPGFRGARPLGLHLEGPYLNPERKGAHNPRYLRSPDLDEIAEWTPANGVLLVTLAPELPSALPLIAALADRGVLVSAGHTQATVAEAQAGVEAGIRYATHLFNAMAPLHHREPGVAGALLADERVMVGMIVDGRHVHPLLVKLARQLLGPRLNLVSDAMAALGLPPGDYRLADYSVHVGQDARLADGTLAGSILAPDQALRNLVEYTGCTSAEAVAAISTAPAGLLGLPKGQIAPGFDADLVLLSPDLHVRLTIIGGQVAYSATEVA